MSKYKLFYSKYFKKNFKSQFGGSETELEYGGAAVRHHESDTISSLKSYQLDISKIPELNKIEIRNSRVHGKGVYAKEDITEGTILLFEKAFIKVRADNTINELLAFIEDEKNKKKLKLLTDLTIGDMEHLTKIMKNLKVMGPISRKYPKEKFSDDHRKKVYNLFARFYCNSFQNYPNRFLFYYGSRFNHKFHKPNASREILKKSDTTEIEYFCIWASQDIKKDDEIFINYLPRYVQMAPQDLDSIVNFTNTPFGNIRLTFPWSDDPVDIADFRPSIDYFTIGKCKYFTDLLIERIPETISAEYDMELHLQHFINFYDFFTELEKNNINTNFRYSKLDIS